MSLSVSILDAPSEFIKLASFPDTRVLVKLAGSDSARWYGLSSSDPVIGMLLRTLSTAATHVQDPCEAFPLGLSSRESLFFSSKNDFPCRKYELLLSFHVPLVALASRKLIVQHTQTYTLYNIGTHIHAMCYILIFNQIYQGIIYIS